MKTSFYSDYADTILHTALRIQKGDVLSINTEEEDYLLSRIIAEKAKRITGNGSYIQLLKNGRVVEEFDILSDFPLRKKPTLFLYLSNYRAKDEPDITRIYEAKDLQRFSLLSDPLTNPRPSLPFVTSFLPSPEWNKVLKMNDDEKTSEELLSSLFSSKSDYDIMHDNLLYKTKALNQMNLKEGRITSENGTDLSFSFLNGSSFHSSYQETERARLFSPYIISCDVFRLIDPTSLSGWLNTTRPFVIWGKVVRNLSLLFENGRVVKTIGSEYAMSLFSHYMRQDKSAARASMLTLSEKTNPLWNEEVTYIPELDRMRTVSITLGGPKGEAVDEGLEEKTVDCLLSLSLPIGDETLTLECLDADENERTVYSDGSINEEDDEY